jgi:glycosyltransferase involved in cell wall biosynthesis
MRVFFVAPVLPQHGHTVRAISVVVREALAAFAELGHELVFQPLLAPESGDGEAGGEPEGTELLPPLEARHDALAASRPLLVRQAFSADPAAFYPSHALRKELAARVDRSGAGVAFHLWCSAAFAACSEVRRPVFAYAGNPDHYAMTARLGHPDLFGIPQATVRNRVKLRVWRAAYRRFERVHLRMVSTSGWVGCVSAANAEYYRARGIANAFYVQNMWPAPDGPFKPPHPSENRIIGNIGGQYATGNTFGLWFLGREVLPELDRLLGDDYAVHLFGAGSLFPRVAAAVDHPRVVNRHFVDDIDAELRSAKVFLLANNNNPSFIVGHTRILHAWSLGSCLVAHRNMARAMPELVHGENALLGETGAELAEHAAAAMADDGLRRRIAEGGRHTYEREFRPEVVIGRVVERIEHEAGRSVGGS